MIVLGIDPGIAITGCAVVAEEKGKLTLLASDAITTSANLITPQRLEVLYHALCDIIRKEKPEAAALESLFFNTNAKTALIVGQARGVVQLALRKHRIAIFEYTPLRVKLALSGYGRADKAQIQQMVKQILRLSYILTPDDVSDAAAIAITHCFSYKLHQKTEV